MRKLKCAKKSCKFTPLTKIKKILMKTKHLLLLKMVLASPDSVLHDGKNFEIPKNQLVFWPGRTLLKKIFLRKRAFMFEFVYFF